jgi:hypothetical protein
MRAVHPWFQAVAVRRHALPGTRTGGHLHLAVLLGNVCVSTEANR